MAALEVLAYVDYSLAIKAGVHYTLCGGTICKLGTKVRACMHARTPHPPTPRSSRPLSFSQHEQFVRLPVASCGPQTNRATPPQQPLRIT